VVEKPDLSGCLLRPGFLAGDVGEQQPFLQDSDGGSRKDVEVDDFQQLGSVLY